MEVLDLDDPTESLNFVHKFFLFAQYLGYIPSILEVEPDVEVLIAINCVFLGLFNDEPELDVVADSEGEVDLPLFFFA